MSLEKMSFTDSELLYYGVCRRFPEDPCDSLLSRFTGNERPDALVRLAEKHPEILPLTDAVVSAAMTPGRTLRVFAGSEAGFLRLRMAQHITDASDGAYSVLIGSGVDGNLMQVLPPQDVLKVVCELCRPAAGGDTAPQSQVPIAFQMSVLEQLAFLGACHVILQNRYEGGWFTSAAVSNAFDCADFRDFSELCAPMAEVADRLIYSAVGPEGFGQALEAMVNSGMLIKRMVDNVPLYSFIDTLKALPKQLDAARERFALDSVDKFGGFHLLYALAGESGQWCFYANNTDGCLIRTGHEGLTRLLTEMLMPGTWPRECASGEDIVLDPQDCAHCGRPLAAGDKFCGGCGAAIKKG